LAADKARKHGWFLVQDTARENYQKTPVRIMQGYLTIMTEALEQLPGDTPTHVFVQCGVGSFAAALQACLVKLFGKDRPVFAVVEPEKAACFYESMLKKSTNPYTVRGDMNTIMAGLACGEPSILAWRILRQYADMFLACDDSVTVKGMQILGHPLPGDERIISGESGAVTAGLIHCVRKVPAFQEIAHALGINQGSRILLISTEGDTDPGAYRKILSARNPFANK
jgi:diaminopropionate ammonia-lyase